MNKKRIAAATLVLVIGVAVVVLGATRRREHIPVASAALSASGHGAGIDHAMSAVVALYHAPQGATPCETAYNAFKNSQDVAGKENVTPVVFKLAPRDQFIATCSGLGPESQKCMVPIYLAEHRPECKPAKPAQDVLDSMVQLKHAAEPGSQGADGEQQLEP